jgi:DNA-binding LytR/AlgR family response regulator
VKDAFEKIEESDITYVNSDHVYLEIHTTAKQRFVIRKSLTEFMEELSPDFMRIHKSHAVNLRHVNKVMNNSVMVGDLELVIGKSFKTDFLEAVHKK